MIHEELEEFLLSYPSWIKKMKLPIYMDYHATTPVDQRVVDAILPYFTTHFGNAASKQHSFGWTAEEAVEYARRIIARTINADAKEMEHDAKGGIIFTSGATESNNLALKGIAESFHARGNHIITAQTEHRSVLDVCRGLEEHGFEVSYVPVDGNGLVNVDDIRQAITEKTILVSVMMANNEIGTIAPVAEIGKLCAERGIIFHTDATQAVGKIPVDVQAMNIHLMSFSAHKIYGPKGIGALYVRSKNPYVKLVPQIDGGGHERGMRSGTLNVPAIIGFGKAMQLAAENLENESARISRLRNMLEHRFMNIEETHVNGHPALRLHNNLNVTFSNVPADDLMMALRNDVAISSGSACSSADFEAGKVSHVLKAIGLDDEHARCSVRFGLGRFTTEEEVRYVAEKVTKAVEEIRRKSPARLIAERQRTVEIE
jgi:cysteine desulfurase